MSETRRIPRLDEVLLGEHLVTEDQLGQALQRQKIFGGRLGTQLLSLGFVDEAALVKALATQQQCAGVTLADKDISEVVASYVPATVAVARKVMPFAFDEVTNTLSIACEEPTNQTLIDELKFVVAGKNIKMFVAAELSLNAA